MNNPAFLNKMLSLVSSRTLQYDKIDFNPPPPPPPSLPLLFPLSPPFLRPPPPPLPEDIESRKAIGIDFGTTSCAVAVFKKGIIDIAEDLRGNRRVPSCVAFNQELSFGTEASDRLFTDTEVVTGFKRAMIYDINEFSVEYKNKINIVSMTLILALLLREMKNCAEHTLQHPVEHAIISVPDCFNDAHKQIIVDGASLAGLRVMSLIDAPTAVAIEYIKNNGDLCHFTPGETFLTFDLGGGYCKVGIFKITETGGLDKLTSGCLIIGGMDFDNTFTEMLKLKFPILESIEKSFCDDSRKKILYDRKIQNISEKLKKTLSLLPDATVNFDFGNEDIVVNCTRKEFNGYIKEHVDQINEFVGKLLTSINLTGVDQVVLSGGASRIPIVMYHLKKYGNINKTINREDSAAKGAAYVACDLFKIPLTEYFDPDVSPFDEDMYNSLLRDIENIKKLDELGSQLDETLFELKKKTVCCKNHIDKLVEINNWILDNRTMVEMLKKKEEMDILSNSISKCEGDGGNHLNLKIKEKGCCK